MVKKSDSITVIWILIVLGSRIRIHIELKSDLDLQHCSKGSGFEIILPYKTEFEFSLASGLKILCTLCRMWTAKVSLLLQPKCSSHTPAQISR